MIPRWLRMIASRFHGGPRAGDAHGGTSAGRAGTVSPGQRQLKDERGRGQREAASLGRPTDAGVGDPARGLTHPSEYREGLILPLGAPRRRPLLKGLAAATACAFTLTTLLPPGWFSGRDSVVAWAAEPDPETLRTLSPDESSALLRLKELLKFEDQKGQTPEGSDPVVPDGSEGEKGIIGIPQPVPPTPAINQLISRLLGIGPRHSGPSYPPSELATAAGLEKAPAAVNPSFWTTVRAGMDAQSTSSVRGEAVPPQAVQAEETSGWELYRRDFMTAGVAVGVTMLVGLHQAVAQDPPTPQDAAGFSPYTEEQNRVVFDVQSKRTQMSWPRKAFETHAPKPPDTLLEALDKELKSFGEELKATLGVEEDLVAAFRTASGPIRRFGPSDGQLKKMDRAKRRKMSSGSIIWKPDELDDADPRKAKAIFEGIGRRMRAIAGYGRALSQPPGSFRIFTGAYGLVGEKQLDRVKAWLARRQALKKFGGLLIPIFGSPLFAISRGTIQGARQLIRKMWEDRVITPDTHDGVVRLGVDIEPYLLEDYKKAEAESKEAQARGDQAAIREAAEKLAAYWQNIFRTDPNDPGLLLYLQRDFSLLMEQETQRTFKDVEITAFVPFWFFEFAENLKDLGYTIKIPKGVRLQVMNYRNNTRDALETIQGARRATGPGGIFEGTPYGVTAEMGYVPPEKRPGGTYDLEDNVSFFGHEGRLGEVGEALAEALGEDPNFTHEYVLDFPNRFLLEKWLIRGAPTEAERNQYRVTQIQFQDQLTAILRWLTGEGPRPRFVFQELAQLPEQDNKARRTALRLFQRLFTGMLAGGFGRALVRSPIGTAQASLYYGKFSWLLDLDFGIWGPELGIFYALGLEAWTERLGDEGAISSFRLVVVDPSAPGVTQLKDPEGNVLETVSGKEVPIPNELMVNAKNRDGDRLITGLASSGYDFYFLPTLHVPEVQERVVGFFRTRLYSGTIEPITIDSEQITVMPGEFKTLVLPLRVGEDDRRNLVDPEARQQPDPAARPGQIPPMSRVEIVGALINTRRGVEEATVLDAVGLPAYEPEVLSRTLRAERTRESLVNKEEVGTQAKIEKYRMSPLAPETLPREAAVFLPLRRGMDPRRALSRAATQEVGRDQGTRRDRHGLTHVVVQSEAMDRLIRAFQEERNRFGPVYTEQRYLDAVRAVLDKEALWAAFRQLRALLAEARRSGLGVLFLVDGQDLRHLNPLEQKDHFLALSVLTEVVAFQLDSAQGIAIRNPIPYLHPEARVKIAEMFSDGQVPFAFVGQDSLPIRVGTLEVPQILDATSPVRYGTTDQLVAGLKADREAAGRIGRRPGMAMVAAKQLEAAEATPAGPEEMADRIADAARDPLWLANLLELPRAYLSQPHRVALDFLHLRKLTPLVTGVIHPFAQYWKPRDDRFSTMTVRVRGVDVQDPDQQKLYTATVPVIPGQLHPQTRPGANGPDSLNQGILIAVRGLLKGPYLTQTELFGRAWVKPPAGEDAMNLFPVGVVVEGHLDEGRRLVADHVALAPLNIGSYEKPIVNQVTAGKTELQISLDPADHHRIVTIAGKTLHLAQNDQGDLTVWVEGQLRPTTLRRLDPAVRAQLGRQGAETLHYNVNGQGAPFGDLAVSVGLGVKDGLVSIWLRSPGETQLHLVQLWEIDQQKGWAKRDGEISVSSPAETVPFQQATGPLPPTAPAELGYSDDTEVVDVRPQTVTPRGEPWHGLARFLVRFGIPTAATLAAGQMVTQAWSRARTVIAKRDEITRGGASDRKSKSIHWRARIWNAGKTLAMVTVAAAVLWPFLGAAALSTAFTVSSILAKLVAAALLSKLIVDGIGSLLPNLWERVPGRTMTVLQVAFGILQRLRDVGTIISWGALVYALIGGPTLAWNLTKLAEWVWTPAWAVSWLTRLASWPLLQQGIPGVWGVYTKALTWSAFEGKGLFTLVLVIGSGLLLWLVDQVRYKEWQAEERGEMLRGWQRFLYGSVLPTLSAVSAVGFLFPAVLAGAGTLLGIAKIVFLLAVVSVVGAQLAKFSGLQQRLGSRWAPLVEPFIGAATLAGLSWLSVYVMGGLGWISQPFGGATVNLLTSGWFFRFGAQLFGLALVANMIGFSLPRRVVVPLLRKSAEHWPFGLGDWFFRGLPPTPRLWVDGRVRRHVEAAIMTYPNGTDGGDAVDFFASPAGRQVLGALGAHYTSVEDLQRTLEGGPDRAKPVVEAFERWIIETQVQPAIEASGIPRERQDEIIEAIRHIVGLPPLQSALIRDGRIHTRRLTETELDVIEEELIRIQATADADRFVRENTLAFGVRNLQDLIDRLIPETAVDLGSGGLVEQAASATRAILAALPKTDKTLGIQKWLEKALSVLSEAEALDRIYFAAQMVTQARNAARNAAKDLVPDAALKSRTEAAPLESLASSLEKLADGADLLAKRLIGLSRRVSLPEDLVNFFASFYRMEPEYVVQLDREGSLDRGPMRWSFREMVRYMQQKGGVDAVMPRINIDPNFGLNLAADSSQGSQMIQYPAAGSFRFQGSLGTNVVSLWTGRIEAGAEKSLWTFLFHQLPRWGTGHEGVEREAYMGKTFQWDPMALRRSEFSKAIFAGQRDLVVGRLHQDDPLSGMAGYHVAAPQPIPKNRPYFIGMAPQADRYTRRRVDDDFSFEGPPGKDSWAFGPDTFGPGIWGTRLGLNFDYLLMYPPFSYQLKQTAKGWRMASAHKPAKWALHFSPEGWSPQKQLPTKAFGMGLFVLVLAQAQSARPVIQQAGLEGGNTQPSPLPLPRVEFRPRTLEQEHFPEAILGRGMVHGNRHHRRHVMRDVHLEATDWRGTDGKLYTLSEAPDPEATGILLVGPASLGTDQYESPFARYRLRPIIWVSDWITLRRWTDIRTDHPSWSKFRKGWAKRLKEYSLWFYDGSGDTLPGKLLEWLHLPQPGAWGWNPTSIAGAVLTLLIGLKILALPAFWWALPIIGLLFTNRIILEEFLRKPTPAAMFRYRKTPMISGAQRFFDPMRVLELVKKGTGRALPEALPETVAVPGLEFHPRRPGDRTRFLQTGAGLLNEKGLWETARRLASVYSKEDRDKDNRKPAPSWEREYARALKRGLREAGIRPGSGEFVAVQYALMDLVRMTHYARGNRWAGEQHVGSPNPNIDPAGDPNWPFGGPIRQDPHLFGFVSHMQQIGAAPEKLYPEFHFRSWRSGGNPEGPPQGPGADANPIALQPVSPITPGMIGTIDETDLARGFSEENYLQPNAEEIRRTAGRRFAEYLEGRIGKRRWLWRLLSPTVRDAGMADPGFRTGRLIGLDRLLYEMARGLDRLGRPGQIINRVAGVVGSALAAWGVGWVIMKGIVALSATSQPVGWILGGAVGIYVGFQAIKGALFGYRWDQWAVRGPWGEGIRAISSLPGRAFQAPAYWVYKQLWAWFHHNSIQYGDLGVNRMMAVVGAVAAAALGWGFKIGVVALAGASHPAVWVILGVYGALLVIPGMIGAFSDEKPRRWGLGFIPIPQDLPESLDMLIIRKVMGLPKAAFLGSIHNMEWPLIIGSATPPGKPIGRGKVATQLATRSEAEAIPLIAILWLLRGELGKEGPEVLAPWLLFSAFNYLPSEAWDYKLALAEDTLFGWIMAYHLSEDRLLKTLLEPITPAVSSLFVDYILGRMDERRDEQELLQDSLQFMNGMALDHNLRRLVSDGEWGTLEKDLTRIRGQSVEKQLRIYASQLWALKAFERDEVDTGDSRGSGVLSYLFFNFTINQLYSKLVQILGPGQVEALLTFQIYQAVDEIYKGALAHQLFQMNEERPGNPLQGQQRETGTLRDPVVVEQLLTGWAVNPRGAWAAVKEQLRRSMVQGAGSQEALEAEAQRLSDELEELEQGPRAGITWGGHVRKILEGITDPEELQHVRGLREAFENSVYNRWLGSAIQKFKPLAGASDEKDIRKILVRGLSVGTGRYKLQATSNLLQLRMVNDILVREGKHRIIVPSREVLNRAKVVFPVPLGDHPERVRRVPDRTPVAAQATAGLEQVAEPTETASQSPVSTSTAPPVMAEPTSTPVIATRPKGPTRQAPVAHEIASLPLAQGPASRSVARNDEGVEPASPADQAQRTITRLSEKWGVTLQAGAWMAAVAPDVVDRYPHLQGLVGKSAQMGQGWLVILPKDAEGMSQVLIDVIATDQPIAVTEFTTGSALAARIFGTFEILLKDFVGIKVVARSNVEGATFTELLYQILVNVAGVAPGKISAEDLVELEQALAVLA